MLHPNDIRCHCHGLMAHLLKDFWIARYILSS
jgi:hypothetical protein